jgi:nucleoside-diphosphate-sugar epimerase
LPVTICRVFNNYGPRETNLHILPEIIKQLREGNRLYLGNTTTRRDYIYTSDTARAFMLLSKTIPRPVETVNVSSGHHSSVDELIAHIGKILGRQIEVVTDPKRFRKADKQVQVADLAKLKALTGWTPAVGLDQGLESLLRFEGLLK